jgi:hypothetical protein
MQMEPLALAKAEVEKVPKARCSPVTLPAKG